MDQLLQDATQARDLVQDPPLVVDTAQAAPHSHEHEHEHELKAESNQNDTPTVDLTPSEAVSSPLSTPEETDQVWTACMLSLGQLLLSV